MIVAQTNEQVDDLSTGSRTRRRSCAIGRLSAADYVPSRAGRRSTRRCVVRSPSRATCGGRRSSSARPRSGPPSPTALWPWAIVDEAYQMRSDALLRVAGRFERALFVGDPGQLDPFSTVDIERWTGLTWDPMQSAVAVLLRHNPDLPVAPAAGVVAAAGLGGAGGLGGVLPVHRRSAPARGRTSGGCRSGPRRSAAEPVDRRAGDGRGDGLGAVRAAGPAHPAHRRRGGGGVRRAGACGCWSAGAVARLRARAGAARR